MTPPVKVIVCQDSCQALQASSSSACQQLPMAVIWTSSPRLQQQLNSNNPSFSLNHNPQVHQDSAQHDRLSQASFRSDDVGSLSFSHAVLNSPELFSHSCMASWRHPSSLCFHPEKGALERAMHLDARLIYYAVSRAVTHLSRFYIQ